jgi:tetratricopeptide (TPR) repeat protein
LNSAINRLRDALSDSADFPKYIETIPRRGYRFIASVERLNGNVAAIVEAKPEPSPRRAEQWRWFAGAGVTAVLIVGAFAGWRLSHPPKKLLNFSARDWVLISNFENRSGNPVLDGTLEYALERELSNSQFVSIVPRQRVDDALRLMKKPLDTKIDAALGREICLRDGGIRALLTGRVEKLGTTYVLSAQLVNPADGVTVASMSEEDPDDSQMVAAVRRLSNRVRETLGEKRAFVQQNDRRMEKVTTPSLHALQLYTQADELMRLVGDNQPAAAELLKKSIAEDPSFASAHLLLAWTYANTDQDQKARPEFQRALDLADTTSDRERLFILGSYYDVVAKDAPKAIGYYEALLLLYPDHTWASGNIMDLYLQSGRIKAAADLCIRLADSRPDDWLLNQRAVWAKLIGERDWNGAQHYLQRGVALAAAKGNSEVAIWEGTWVEVFPVYAKWLQGNVVEAHADLLQLERSATTARDHELFGILFILFDQFREAERQFQTIPDFRQRELDLAQLAFVKDDLSEVRRHLLNVGLVGVGDSEVLIVAARAGLVTQLESVLHDEKPCCRPIVMGELSLARGDVARAEQLLEEGLKPGPSAAGNSKTWPIQVSLFGSESLARVYTKEHKFQEAVRALQSAWETKAWNNGLWESFAWSSLRIRLQLADLYREMGRTSEAEQVEDELSKLLIYADSDDPIVRELQKRHQLVATSPK